MLDELDRALASIPLMLRDGHVKEAIWWVGEAEKHADTLRNWINDQPDNTI